jgi:RNA polymerase sigma factor (sigma-70 family)
VAETIQALTSAIASGDTEAFARFYRQWFDFVYGETARAAGFRARDEQFCMDIVQETMLRVIRHLRPMPTEADLRRWLRVVVQSCCYDAFRRELRRRQHERSAANREAAAACTHELHEQLHWLREQLAALPPDQVNLLSMRFRLGWTLQRIGEALGLKPGAVDGRIARTLSQLRRNSGDLP